MPLMAVSLSAYSLSSSSFLPSTRLMNSGDPTGVPRQMMPRSAASVCLDTTLTPSGMVPSSLFMIDYVELLGVMN